MGILIDSHCHLHDREFFSASQAEKMLERAHQNGVAKIICIGTSVSDSRAARDFAKSHENVFWTYGIHPSEAGKIKNNDLATFDELLNAKKVFAPCGEPSKAGKTSSSLETPFSQQASPQSPREKVSLSKEGNFPIAIGEVGLDYHYGAENRAAQIKLFEQMLDLGQKLDLPFSFHIREAFDDFFPVIANFPKLRGVVHSFSDNKKNLRRILNETGFYVGVNGLATYSTLPTPPLERILLETDAPFLTPKPFRGIMNEPGYVGEVALWLSQKLNLDFQEIAKETTKNVNQLFYI